MTFWRVLLALGISRLWTDLLTWLESAVHWNKWTFVNATSTQIQTTPEHRTIAISSQDQWHQKALPDLYPPLPSSTPGIIVFKVIFEIFHKFIALCVMKTILLGVCGFGGHPWRKFAWVGDFLLVWRNAYDATFSIFFSQTNKKKQTMSAMLRASTRCHGNFWSRVSFFIRER